MLRECVPEDKIKIKLDRDCVPCWAIWRFVMALLTGTKTRLTRSFRKMARFV